MKIKILLRYVADPGIKNKMIHRVINSVKLVIGFQIGVVELMEVRQPIVSNAVKFVTGKIIDKYKYKYKIIHLFVTLTNLFQSKIVTTKVNKIHNNFFVFYYRCDSHATKDFSDDHCEIWHISHGFSLVKI
jgi:hypothetical protein